MVSTVVTEDHILAEFDLRGEQKRLRLAVAAMTRARAVLGEDGNLVVSQNKGSPM